MKCCRKKSNEVVFIRCIVRSTQSSTKENFSPSDFTSSIRKQKGPLSWSFTSFISKVQLFWPSSPSILVRPLYSSKILVWSSLKTTSSLFVEICQMPRSLEDGRGFPGWLKEQGTTTQEVTRASRRSVTVAFQVSLKAMLNRPE